MKKDMLTKTWAVAAIAFVCCVLWGSAAPAIKTGYAHMGIASSDVASILVYAGVRFMIAGLMVLIFDAVSSRKIMRPDGHFLKMAFQLSLVQTAGQYFFFYIGVAHTSGVKTSILTATNTFIAIIMASLIFRQEKLTGRKILGCCVGFAGVVLINLLGNSMDMAFQWNGELFIIFAAAAYALSSVMIKNYSREVSPVQLSGCQFFMGGLILTIIGFGMGGKVGMITPFTLGIWVYLGMVSAVAYTLWSILLKYNPVSKVTIFGFMNPLCGVIISAIVLGEGEQAFSLGGLAALILVCIGICIVNRPEKNRREE